MTDRPRPRLRLADTAGNAFSLLGSAIRAARAAGWSEDEIKAFNAEATRRDYYDLPAIIIRHFDVEYSTPARRGQARNLSDRHKLSR